LKVAAIELLCHPLVVEQMATQASGDSSGNVTVVFASGGGAPPIINKILANLYF
jgi:hypothetical protein